jgi:hypothetical protein
MLLVMLCDLLESFNADLSKHDDGFLHFDGSIKSVHNRTEILIDSCVVRSHFSVSSMEFCVYSHVEALSHGNNNISCWM